MNKTSKRRARAIERGINLAWSSLESHLDYARGKKPCDSQVCRDETPKFHQRCVQEYAELISILSKLY